MCESIQLGAATWQLHARSVRFLEAVATECGRIRYSFGAGNNCTRQCVCICLHARSYHWTACMSSIWTLRVSSCSRTSCMRSLWTLRVSSNTPVGRQSTPSLLPNPPEVTRQTPIYVLRMLPVMVSRQSAPTIHQTAPLNYVPVGTSRPQVAHHAASW